MSVYTLWSVSLIFQTCRSSVLCELAACCELLRSGVYRYRHVNANAWTCYRHLSSLLHYNPRNKVVMRVVTVLWLS